MKIELKREKKSPTGILGKLLVGGVSYSTLELPWKDNATNISAIPDGVYEVSRHVSPKFGECFRVDGVKGRTDILIHAGNTTEDTKGCILVGASFEEQKGGFRLLSSKIALSELLRRLPKDEKITLEIKA